MSNEQNGSNGSNNHVANGAGEQGVTAKTIGGTVRVSIGQRAAMSRNPSSSRSPKRIGLRFA